MCDDIACEELDRKLEPDHIGYLEQIIATAWKAAAARQCWESRRAEMNSIYEEIRRHYAGLAQQGTNYNPFTSRFR